MNLLYELRAHTPTLQEYWLLPEALPQRTPWRPGRPTPGYPSA